MILAFSEGGVYHKYLHTDATPSPPCVSIQHRVSTYSFTLLFILTVLCFYTVIGFTLDANDSHLRFMQAKVKAGAFQGYFDFVCHCVCLYVTCLVPYWFT